LSLIKQFTVRNVVTFTFFVSLTPKKETKSGETRWINNAVIFYNSLTQLLQQINWVKEPAGCSELVVFVE